MKGIINFHQNTQLYSINRFIILFAFSWFVMGCQANQEEVSNARTYYDSLELDTPELAVQTFIDAFHRADFVTTYMVFAPATQQELRSQGFELSLDNFIQEGLSIEDEELFIQTWTDRIGPDRAEHIQDTMHVFNTMMRSAAELGFMPFQFEKNFEILGTESVTTSDGQEATDLMIMFEGSENSIVFRLMQSPDERWRVFQVIWPGGDETEIPWALGPHITSEPMTIVHENTGTGYQEFDLSTPEKAVRVFCQMFREENFSELYWLLHPEAQQKWWFDFGLMRYQNLTRTDESLFYETDFGQRIEYLKESGLINNDDILFISNNIRNNNDFARSIYTPLVMEHIGDTSYLFDQIMLAARGHYLIDLSQPITIKEVREESLENNETIAIVLVGIEGEAGELTFRLRKTPSGQWRIWQVSAPGGDANMFPWSVPPS